MHLLQLYTRAPARILAACLAAVAVAPAAGAQTLNMCGQSVQYTVVPPSPQVPANLSAFSGVWVGNWPSGVCHVMVIENVMPDGTVSILDVYGPDDSGKAGGTMRYPGKIVGNTLSSAGRATAIELTQAGTTQLAATFVSATANARGTFHRP
jgi:hypothetical protein